jgi:selenocysteine lyase/cysteine desulfurase
VDASVSHGRSARAERVRQALRGAELPLLATLLDYLSTRRDIRLLGPAKAQLRAATVSFVTHALDPVEAAKVLAERGFSTGYGNFYAVRLLEGMNVDPQRGALRLSLVHYNSPAEVAGVIDALEQVLPRQSRHTAA